MSDPIFVLGSHQSGTSVVAGLLHRVCGVSMGELTPPTEYHPLGNYEALGVVDAHRDLLTQMERDWTCPPSRFRPDAFDLTALKEQVDIHKQLPGVWAVKDPCSMFLLPAWSHLGVDRLRLVAVVRPVADTVRSIERRHRIRQDRAEAIVDTYLRRLVEIADKRPLPVVQFPGDGVGVVRQVRAVAASLDLPWDEETAQDFFNSALVRHRSRLRDSSPTYDSLIQKARFRKELPVINPLHLKLGSEPEWPLETHLGVRYGQQINELWEMAHFSADPKPDVVEVLLDGAQAGRTTRPGVKLHQIEAKSPLVIGAVLMKKQLRPHGVIAHGFLRGRSSSETEFFFRSLYVNTDPLAELVVDVPDPHAKGLLSVRPRDFENPLPARVQEIASQCGWDHIATERLSPGRSGMMLRKRVLTDSELIPVVTDLISNIQRVRTIDERLSVIEDRIQQEEERELRIAEEKRREREAERRRADEAKTTRAIRAERERADEAERALARLQNRRSVRLALALARPMRGLFRAVRSWKKKS